MAEFIYGRPITFNDATIDGIDERKKKDKNARGY